MAIVEFNGVFDRLFDEYVVEARRALGLPPRAIISMHPRHAMSSMVMPGKAKPVMEQCPNCDKKNQPYTYTDTKRRYWCKCGHQWDTKR